MAEENEISYGKAQGACYLAVRAKPYSRVRHWLLVDENGPRLPPGVVRGLSFLDNTTLEVLVPSDAKQAFMRVMGLAGIKMKDFDLYNTNRGSLSRALQSVTRLENDARNTDAKYWYASVKKRLNQMVTMGEDLTEDEIEEETERDLKERGTLGDKSEGRAEGSRREEGRNHRESGRNNGEETGRGVDDIAQNQASQQFMDDVQILNIDASIGSAAVMDLEEDGIEVGE